MAAAAAAALTAAGVGPGDRCALLAENSARWCAAYLGILRIGAIVVPLDTSYSTAQVATLLRDSGARGVIASVRFETLAAAAAAEAGCAMFPMESPAGGHTRSPVRCEATPASPAVILYTSGTTADPKGVILTHGNLLAEKNAACQVVQVDERDVVLGVLPLFHALAQMANLLLPLSLGAHVVFLDTLNTRELLLALQQERISVFCCVPQFFYLIHQRVMSEVTRGGIVRRTSFAVLLRVSAMLRGVGINVGPLLFGRVHRSLGPAMRLLITGGSRFDPAIGHDLHAMGFTILQAYGLTETSGAATVTRPGEPIDTVGRALPGVEIRIAPPESGHDDGEVLICGPIVMAGYWNRPDATATVLRDGWFHSGDLGRIDADGRLTITGRSKELIVLQSGKNIHPEEIEAHYCTSAFIKELCVIGITDPAMPSAERLHAIVVPDAEALRERRIVNVRELIRFELESLSVVLPGHKRVLGFDVSMEPLPRTTTGKLKRHAIATTAATSVRQSASGTVAVDRVASVPPDVPPHVARVVTAVQRAMPKTATVTADSNFELDLGLDSMERVELLAAVEQELGANIPEDAAQGAFTVRQLADALAAAADLKVRSDEKADEAGQPVAADLRVRHGSGWPSVLQQTTLEARQQELLRSERPLVALLLFIVVRILAAVLFRPRVSGREHLPGRGPFIVAPNHQSYLDPIPLVGVLPFRIVRQLFFVGAAEYFETRASAWLAAQLNIVPVDPDARLVPAMQAGAFGLRAGKVLVLFPEGERSIDGGVKTFKKGAALLSEHLDVPIVPVAIDGVYDIWPRNRPLDWRRLLPWSGHHVDISIGAPLPPAERDRLRDAVDGMWRRLHANS